MRIQHVTSSGKPDLYQNLRPKLSPYQNSDIYSNYNSKMKTDIETKQFRPTSRPFNGFKLSRNDAKLIHTKERNIQMSRDQATLDRNESLASSRRKNTYHSSKGRSRKKTKSRRKTSDHDVFKQMNEHRKKSGEKRNVHTFTKTMYQNDNYGHPNHYEQGDGKEMNNDYHSTHQVVPTHQDTHRNLDLKIDRHDIDYIIPKKNKKHKKGDKSDDEDYEYMYYYYYDYVYPDDDIAQSLGENGEWLNYGPQQRSNDFSASQRNNGESYEMLPQPLAANGTSILSNSSGANVITQNKVDATSISPILYTTEIPETVTMSEKNTKNK